MGGTRDGRARRRDGGRTGPAEDLTCRPRAGDRRAQGRVRSGSADKGEFDLRVGQVFASRTYADLDALTADIPDGVTSAQPSAEHAREPGRVLSFKTAARVGAVGAGPSMASAAVVLVHSSGVPAVAGVLLVGLTGLFVAGLLAALLMLLSWVVRRSQRRAAQGPPFGSGRSGIQAPGADPAAAVGEARSMAYGRSGQEPPPWECALVSASVTGPGA